MKLVLDAKTALCDQEMFDSLYEYSCSLPTGTTVGKRWKRAKNTYDGKDGWLLGEYVECYPIDPDTVKVKFRELLVVE